MGSNDIGVQDWVSEIAVCGSKMRRRQQPSKGRAQCAPGCDMQQGFEQLGTRLGQNREARANGLPVTLNAKEYCGISGLQTDEVHALILEAPRDACALASELRRSLFEPLLRQRSVDAGLEFVSQHQWTSVASHQRFLYHAASSCSPNR